MENTVFNVIIADDHSMFLDGLLSIFSEDNTFNVAMTAKNGDMVVKYLGNNKDEHIHLLITDIHMPEVDGITLNKYVKKNHPSIKTLVVSMSHESSNIHRLTEDDVDGYVSKNAEKKELLLAMETILNGGKFFSESIKQAYMQSMFKRDEEGISSLTKREKDVLTLIAKEYTTQEIADKLFLSKHTIEGYRKNLISKLDVRNLAGLTKYAIKLGLV